MPSRRLTLPTTLESCLLQSVDSNVMTLAQADDVLLAREVFNSKLDEIAPTYEGFAGSTVDGVLVYGATLGAIITQLSLVNPPNRCGYWDYVRAVA
jgi:hypothetical protein